MPVDSFAHVADSLRAAANVVDTLLLRPRIHPMAGLTLGNALVSIFLGVIASIVAGFIVGLWFERRSNATLRLFEDVALKNIRVATDAIPQLAQRTREIPVMAESISLLAPLIERLCAAVERGMKR